MYDRTMQDPEYPAFNGSREDGRNLISEWLKDKKVGFRSFTGFSS